jgi:hypothetical protein
MKTVAPTSCGRHRSLVETPWVSFRVILLEDGAKTDSYPAEFRDRALRQWKVRADIDAGREPGTSSKAQMAIKRLRKQIAELERANEILRSASVFFATELGRPSSR